MKIVKKGNYFYAKDNDGSTLAGYSKNTNRFWGQTKYYKELMKVVDCKKIHVEKLMEDAWDWWESKDDPYKTSIVLKIYMEANDLEEDDIEW